jgi:hypothetical protein
MVMNTHSLIQPTAHSVINNLLSLTFVLHVSTSTMSDRNSETNMMHFLFNLLRIKGLYMFRALLAHPQESLHKQHLVYCVRVMSVGCYHGWSGTLYYIILRFTVNKTLNLQGHRQGVKHKGIQIQTILPKNFVY